MSNDILTTKNQQLLWQPPIFKRKVDSDTETKAIERESKNVMWVWKRKLSQKLLENCSTNIISLIISKYIEVLICQH